ncbi:MAG: glycosyltransferase family 4 protein [Salibacteraceae bacterium]
MEENGFDCHISYLIDEEDDRVFYAPGRFLRKLQILLKSYRKRLKDLESLHKYGWVYVQREAFMTGSLFFEKSVARSSTKLLFDFDDSIWLQNVSNANRYLKFLKRPAKTSEIIEIADLVIAGNEYLADYAKAFNSNVSIIPTTIDTDAYRRINQANSDVVTIGWSGSITTIQHFEYAIPFLLKLKQEYGDRIAIKVIGDGNYRNDALDVSGIAWNEKDEIRELSEFDIGIMPLPDDEWAKGKCGLKGLQYMALEIPTIMSPVGVNAQIISHGENGMLAENQRDWEQCLKSLIEDKGLREQLGKRGRETVIDKYSVIANQENYLKLFNQ